MHTMPTFRETISEWLFSTYDRLFLRDSDLVPKTPHEEEYFKLMEAILHNDGEAYMIHNANLRRMAEKHVKEVEVKAR